MRALLLVLEHLAVGHIPEGSGLPVTDSLGQLFHAVPDLELPTLFSLGLDEIMKGRVFDPPAQHCAASYGRMIQRSAGADFLSGLWELAGVTLACPFTPADQLQKDCITSLARQCDVDFLLNASGNPTLLATEQGQLEALRKEHLKTGNPILTLCSDSHLHIAAHESTLPPTRLTQLCRIARQHCDAWHVARVTTQLFSGNPGAWKPAAPAFPLSMVPPRTLLNAISDQGLPVVAVGSINDAFARSGITRAYSTGSAAESMQTIEHLWSSPQNGMLFADFGDLALGGTLAFAQALETFDTWLGTLLQQIHSDDLLIIAGANGSDPAALQPGSPRQEVPVLVRYGGRNAPLGLHETFADVAATLAAFFGIHEHRKTENIGEPLITFHRPRGFSGP